MLDSLTDELVTRRPTIVEIDLSAITDNYTGIQTYVENQRIMCILKANAYGHGMVKIAQHLQSIGVTYLGVAYLEEGILLRKSGITIPILVMGGILDNQIPYFIEYDLTITASSVSKLEQIERVSQSMSQRAKVHLKIDTGMERIGVHYYSAHDLIPLSLAVQHCDVEGIYTHFASADEDDDAISQRQIGRFKHVLDLYDDYQRPALVHYSNSAGLQYQHLLPSTMVRVGLLLYGVYPSDALRSIIQVRPALSWKTRVVYFKVVKPDHPVSYGGKWTSDKMTRVVTLPVGYGDGYMRAMSNKAQVLIRGKKYDNVGAICMDQMMINIEWETAYNNDEVVLIGEQDGQRVSVEDLADWAETIPYEILTNINTRVPRHYHQ